MKLETEFLVLVKRKKLGKGIFTKDRKATLQDAYIGLFSVIYLEKNTVKINQQEKANLDPRVNVEQIRIQKRDQTYNQRKEVLENLKEYRNSRLSIV